MNLIEARQRLRSQNNLTRAALLKFMGIFKSNNTGVDNQSHTGSSHLGQSTTIPLAMLDSIQISNVASIAMKLLPKCSKHLGRFNAVRQST